MATTDIIRTEVQREGGFLPWIMAPERRGPFLVAPAIIVLFLMNIFPLLWSFGLSFYNYRANRQAVPTFEGLANYGRVLTDPVVWERFQTTALIVGSSVLLQLILGFLLALLFERQFPLRRILLTLVLTPMMLSPVAVGVFFKLYYEPTFGLVSQFINAFFTGEPFALLGDALGRHHRHRRRRRLDVVALRDVAGARGPGERAEVPLRGGGGRSRLLVAAFQHHHLPLHPQPAPAGDPVPHHRDLQAVRHRLHHHPGRTRARPPRPSASMSIAWRSRTSAPASRRRWPTSCCSS